MSKFVYADNSATTPISKSVLNTMLPYLENVYGNPSSIYSIARDAKKAIDSARINIANVLGCDSNEVFFTSGGSEGDNWAIKGVAHNLMKKGKKHIITSKFEHHAVLHTCETLAKEGFEITYLDVHSDGLVRVEDLKNAIRDDTALVSIMYANNEIGTIQPIAELAKVAHERGVLFHTDAVQAIGNVEINVKQQGIDMLSMSAHKIHGPKGIGMMYIKKGIVIQNLIDGGAQERGRRAGTENVASIMGLSQAMTDACANIPKKCEYVSKLRDQLFDAFSKIELTHINGSREHRLAGNFNMSFEGIEGESMLLMLDMKGICASSGSACTSGSLDPSHVLLAIGLPHAIAHGSLRLSLNETNTQEDVDYIIETLPPIIERLRSMSPLWERIKNGEKIEDIT